jgi:hypothetical protein
VTFLSNIWRDLVEKRLWPVALALIVALVAVPVLLGRDSSEETVAQPPGAGAAPTAPRPGRAAVKVKAAREGATRERAGTVRDPFKGPRARTARAPTADAPAPGSEPSSNESAGPSPSRGAATPAPAGVPDTAETQPAPEPKPQTQALDVYGLTLRFGHAGRLTTRPDVARLTPLPSPANPFLVFLGVLKDGRTAAFLVSGDAEATGDGNCRASASACETIELQPGDTELFDRQGVRYRMDLVRLARRHVAPPEVAAQTAQRHSSFGAQLLRDAHMRGDKAYAAADGYRWLPDRAVIARATAAATVAGAREQAPGEPVWHYGLG